MPCLSTVIFENIASLIGILWKDTNDKNTKSQILFLIMIGNTILKILNLMDFLIGSTTWWLATVYRYPVINVWQRSDTNIFVYKEKNFFNFHVTALKVVLTVDRKCYLVLFLAVRSVNWLQLSVSWNPVG